MAKALHFLGWCVMGATMATAGVTANTWQFWVIEGCVALIVITRALW